MAECYEGTVVPEQIQEPCGNTYISTNCVTIPAPFIYLDLSAGDSQTLVNQNIILALQTANQLIQELTERIEILEGS